MARLVIQHDVDPAIGIVLEEVPPGTPGQAQGWHGTCTECGWPLHRWRRDVAIAYAKEHVDQHPASVVGIDPSSVVPGQRISQGPVFARPVRGFAGEEIDLIGHNID